MNASAMMPVINPPRSSNAYVPKQERFDLAMSKGVLQKAPKFTSAHLNYLECRGQSIFINERCINLFMNVLRLHWKVSGKVLRSPSDQGTDLYELLLLEMDGVYIIKNFFTDDALYELVQRRTPDGMMIMATIVHAIYNAQWQSWSAEQSVKHKQQGQYALIISHAQAISNQLSNNVLAFRGQTAPELRKWAEMTVARHLMAIVTPGHLRHATTMRQTYSSLTDSSISDLMNVDPTFNQTGGEEVSEQSPSRKRKQVPLHSVSQPRKRRRLGIAPNWGISPYKSTGRFGLSDTYRPSRHGGPTSSNAQSGRKHPTFRSIRDRYDHRRSYASPTTPSSINYASRHDYHTSGLLSYEEACKVKLDEAQAKATRQKDDAILRIDLALESQEHKTPIVEGPSYAEYLRKKEVEAVSPLNMIKSRPFGHVRTQSYVGSEEGEIPE